jgi:energy-coupling factor transporter ATP-binding protein EcfA2
MKLHQVRIERLRSVLNAELLDIGQFNVAIGKNNSGKSTILTAIQTFFLCLGEGQVVALDPPLGDNIDFTKRDTSSPIEIELRFIITLAERDGLLRSIASEAPQVKNAVDGLDPNLLLSATLSIAHGRQQFAYVSRLELVSPMQPQVSRVILGVSEAVAAELRDKLSSIRAAEANAARIKELATRMDEDDWKRLRDGGSANLPRSFYLRRVTGENASPAVEEHFQSLLRSSGTFQEFQRELKSAGERMREEARAQLEQPLRTPLETFSGQDTAVPSYVQECLKLIGSARVLYLGERRKPLGAEEAQRLLELKVRRGGNEALKNIQATVHALLGVHIDAFESAPQRGAEKVAEMDVDDFLLEVNGAGIREALRLILDFEFRQPTILLVEEPEVHLHPALETAMMRYLKLVSNTCQVFVSTHSTNFLDAGDLRNVYLVSKDQYTTIQLLDLEDTQSRIPKELGLRLSSLFMFDRLVFVEGSSDEAVIRELANKLDLNLAQRNVGFIKMGGVRNFSHYASEAILSFLSKRQVELYFLLDHDEQSEQEVQSVKTRLGAKAMVHVLRKREIENYLLESRALQAFLEIKLQSAAKSNMELTPDRINRLLSDCADQLREFTVGKRVARMLCQPVFATNTWVGEIPTLGVKDSILKEIERQESAVTTRKEKIVSVYEKESSELSSRWATEKLDLVPGSELLDKVLQHYGVRFKKETDSSRLAALMTVDEINPELIHFVKMLGH